MSAQSPQHVIPRHVICGVCRAVQERPDGVDARGPAHVWGCRAPRPAEAEPPRWELCRCCTAALLDVTSRWALPFCGPCAARVRSLNQRSGRCVIPVGRHSLVNGVLFDVGADGDVAAFAEQLAAMFRDVGGTEAWRDRRLAENLEALGFPPGEDVDVADYLAAVDAGPDAPAAAYDGMVAWLSRRVGPRDGDR